MKPAHFHIKNYLKYTGTSEVGANELKYEGLSIQGPRYAANGDRYREEALFSGALPAVFSIGYIGYII
jgi:hypothetical protein